jgi:hypothetical protein
MQALFRFLASYEILIYIILFAGLVVTVRWLWQAYHEIQDAVFGLEQQFAMRHMTTAIVAILLIAMVALGELFIASFIVPDLPAATFLLTPTISLLTTQDNILKPGLEATFVGTPSVNSEFPVENSGCVPGKIMVTSPSTGQELSGVIQFFGIVQVENLGFYKFEFTSQGLDNWATFYAGRTIEADKPIGFWDTAQLIPGDYRIRLVVTDNQGKEYPACLITVRVTGSQ